MGGGVRDVAAAYTVLGLAAACFALYALALDPATYRQLQLQMIKDSEQQHPGQGETDCLATAADAMEMRANAAVLLLWAAAQALMALAAVAATSPVGTILAQLLSLPMGWMLLDVVARVIDISIGRCHGSHHRALVAGYAVTFTLLFLFGLVVTLCGKSSCCGQASPVATESREANGAANTPWQGAVSNSTTALAAVSTGKPAPALSGGATTGQGKINHSAASTSQAPPPRRLAAPGNLGSRPQLAHTAVAPPQYGQPPSPASTQQQHLPYQWLPLALPSLPSLPSLPPLPSLPSLPSPQNLSMSLHGSGSDSAGWVALSGGTSHLTSDRPRIMERGGAAPMQQSLQLLQLPSPSPTSVVKD